MIKYTITLDGDFITFNGIAGTNTEGKKMSYRIISIKEIITMESDASLTLVSVDNTTASYLYVEVEDPSTVGVAFVDLNTFRTYMLTNLTV